MEEKPDGFDRSERIDHITAEIQNTIMRLSREYDIRVAELIGAIEIIKLNLYKTFMDEDTD